MNEVKLPPLIPIRDYRYKLSVHLAPTSNHNELLFTTKYRSCNYKKDKRYNLEWCKKVAGSTIKKYVLDYLNPNRSKYLYFDMVIYFHRKSLLEPYHFHICLGDIPNEQYFKSKRNRDFFEYRFGVTKPEELSEKHKYEFYENLFHSMKYKEYPTDKPRKLIMTSGATFHIKEDSKEEIIKYFSKDAFQKNWNSQWDQGVDYKHSLLIQKDI